MKAPAGKPRATKRAGTLGRVLVVEDDPVLALAIEDALIHEGGAEEVVICATTAATMAELEKKRPDAMIIDVHLADRDDGWAIAELVDLLGPKPPRIVFSTGSPNEIPQQVAEMGPVFEKPYDPAALVEVLAGSKTTGLFARLRGKG
ncbi:response regulator [Tsuneonella sp. HG222]